MCYQKVILPIKLLHRAFASHRFLKIHFILIEWTSLNLLYFIESKTDHFFIYH